MGDMIVMIRLSLLDEKPEEEYEEDTRIPPMKPHPSPKRLAVVTPSIPLFSHQSCVLLEHAP